MAIDFTSERYPRGRQAWHGEGKQEVLAQVTVIVGEVLGSREGFISNYSPSSIAGHTSG
jgi:hypothetical protein